MTNEHTQRVMSRYFDDLGKGRFAQDFTTDVTWTTIPDGSCVTGPTAVEQAIMFLHARLGELRTRHVLFGPDVAYLEGSAADSGGRGRIDYCIAYDIAGERISAMRAYGALTPQEGSGGTRSVAEQVAGLDEVLDQGEGAGG